MKTHALVFLFISLVVAQGGANFIHAETVFLDDFSDGSATDGNPARWEAFYSTLNATSGDVVLSGGNRPLGWLPYAIATNLGNGQNPKFADTSIRTQLRLIRGSALGFGVRLDGSHWERANGYYAYLDENMRAEIGVSGGDGVSRGTLLTDLNPKEEDVVMQLDAIGNAIDFRVWRPNESMPTEPLLSFTDGSIRSGNVFLWVDNYGGSPDADALFRYVHVATTPIPEPSSTMLAGLAFAAALVSTRRRA